MRILILIFLFLSFCTISYNQTVKGIILDENTKSPIVFATAYFNGTFVGTHSDQNGCFELDISNNKSMPFIISALGYYSATVSDLSAEKYYRIYLTPKVYALDEVIISARGNSKERRDRKEYVRLFKTVFIGTTSNAQKCKITNENDLFFKISNSGDTIKAYSLNPLLIVNKALGYKISYYLDEFELNLKGEYFYYIGNIIFTEDLATWKVHSQSTQKKRKAAFMGSRMHFFRALWENNLDSTGYTVADINNKKLYYDDMIIQTDTVIKYLKSVGPLAISYFSEKPETHIKLTHDSIFFNKSGNFDGLGIEWDGEMGIQRVADQLPYEYTLTDNKPKH